MPGGQFTEAQRRAMFERANGCCEVCTRRLPEKGWNAHHRQGRGMGGTKRVMSCADGLVVCGSGTTGCHGLIESRRRWAEKRGYVVRRPTRPLEVPVFALGRWVLFNADGTTTPAPTMEVPA